MIDWGIGRYEATASELEPAAEHVVSLAELQPGERVLDLATGTGNAALLAARAGAVVTGVDAAPRLIDVARDRAEGEALDASFVGGNSKRSPSRVLRSMSFCRSSASSSLTTPIAHSGR